MPWMWPHRLRRCHHHHLAQAPGPSHSSLASLQPPALRHNKGGGVQRSHQQRMGSGSVVSLLNMPARLPGPPVNPAETGIPAQGQPVSLEGLTSEACCRANTHPPHPPPQAKPHLTCHTPTGCQRCCTRRRRCRCCCLPLFRFRHLKIRVVVPAAPSSNSKSSNNITTRQEQLHAIAIHIMRPAGEGCPCLSLPGLGSSPAHSRCYVVFSMSNASCWHTAGSCSLLTPAAV